MKRKLVLMVYSVAMLLMVNGCGNNVTINDIQEIDKTPVIESTEESTHVEISSEIEQNKDDEKIDYSWASYEVVKQSFNNVVDDSLIDFYIGASMHLWANASQNFKLEIEKDDSYFWNTIGYDNYNDFLSDYYHRVGFEDVPDYVVNSMAEVTTYEMIWNSLNQDWNKVEKDNINEGLGLGYYLKRLNLPSVKTQMYGSTSDSAEYYMSFNEFSNEIRSNANWIQAGKYGENSAPFAIISQKYAKNLGLTSSVDIIGVNYPYIDRNNGGVYVNLDVDNDGVIDYISLITSEYMHSHKDDPAGFIYIDTYSDTNDMIDKFNMFVGTDVLLNFDKLISDIKSCEPGIYTYPYGTNDVSALSNNTAMVKSRLEKSAGNGTQGSAIASYVYYWKELYGNSDLTDESLKSVGENSINISGDKND